ncbi:4734_t:CDS:2, partial [Scutellospora calospora]
TLEEVKQSSEQHKRLIARVEASASRKRRYITVDMENMQRKRAKVHDTRTKQENIVGGISSIVNMDEDSFSSSYNTVNDAIGSKEKYFGKSYATSGDVLCDNNDNQIEIRKGLESNVDTTENE